MDTLFDKFNAMKTKLTTVQPWGVFVARGSRVLCADGKIRALSRLAQTADTFFSVPAAIKFNIGKQRVTVSGYVTTEETKGADNQYHRVVCFRQHNGQENKTKNLLPAWPVGSVDGFDTVEKLLQLGA